VTALCPGGGPSAPRSTAPTELFVVGESLSSLVTATLGLASPWADALVFLVMQQFDVGALCSTDPPAMPTFTALDIAALLQLNEFISPGAFAKFHDLVAIAAWYALCECTAATTPAPPAAPTYPTGAPVVNPPTLPTTTVQPCWDQTTSLHIPTPTAVTPYYDLTGILLPAGVTTLHVQVQTGFFVDARPIPAGASNVAFRYHRAAGSTWPFVKLIFFNAGGASVDVIVEGGASSWPVDETDRRAAIPTGAVYWSVHAANGYPAQTVDTDLTVELTFYCAGQSPSSPAAPCCPPDPALQGQLTALRTLIELVQRQTAPFAYVTGTVHSGLTGAGHVTVQGLIGCKITITDAGTNVGMEAGDPLAVFNAGWINWGGVDGSSRREFINASPQVSFPAAAGQYTRIGYSLPPGVEVSITELRREP
jgi:hypothetical protein